ncbi:CLUMA_CG002785, isoform A [Clunio marinus]|uniref:CLUMA_CG002785, isoform A n=1 Tax=Clunio marinus TaxID=568069 RepID=A0A1J1HN67_9DIPT|nr:CLUMA_CG002785, isoform A [Clunio marinus]
MFLANHIYLCVCITLRAYSYVSINFHLSYFQKVDVYLSNDIATSVKTEAATVTLAMKLFIVQYLKTFMI